VLDFRNPSVLAKRRIESSLLSLVMVARPFSGIGRTFLAGLEGKGVLGLTSPSAGGASTAQASGRGLGGIIGNPKTAHRYNMIVAMSVQNLLNHTNAGPITGDITSPLFGRANRIAGGPNGEGFFETADNRRLEAQIRFTF
jgi:hypothetical protein